MVAVAIIIGLCIIIAYFGKKLADLMMIESKEE